MNKYIRMNVAWANVYVITFKNLIYETTVDVYLVLRSL